jgi:acyl carrier protein
MVPAHIVTLPEFPLTPNAKVDRRALPPPDLSTGASGDTVAATIQAAPRGELESVIAAHWCTVLNVPAVSVTDNFFELGGHSLLMVQLHHRLREALQPELAITDLFRFPTVRSLAEHLSQDAAVADAALQDASADRASTRKELMQRRRLQRQGSV